INNAGVQSIYGFVQHHTQGIIDVELTGLAQEQLGQIRVDAPVTLLVGIGQRAAPNRSAQPQMVDVSRAGVEASFDVAQSLAPSQLSKAMHTNWLQQENWLTL